jgi:hypothetical protein
VEFGRNALLFSRGLRRFEAGFGVLLFFDGLFGAFLGVVGIFIERRLALISGLDGFTLLLFIQLLKVGIEIFLGLETVHGSCNSI